MEIGKSRQWVLCLGYKTCGLPFLNFIFIVYIAGKSLFILRNKAMRLKAVFYESLYPKIFLLSCIKNRIFWKFIALMDGLLVSEEFLWLP